MDGEEKIWRWSGEFHNVAKQFTLRNNDHGIILLLPNFNTIQKNSYQQNPFSSDLEEVEVAIPCLHDDEAHLLVGVQLSLASHDIL